MSMPALLFTLIAAPAVAQVTIEDGRTADRWYTTVDGDAPGARQAVEAVTDAGRGWLKWTVVTNTDGRFTGYQAQRDVSLDLSRAEYLRWRWNTSGRYLQLQLWSGGKLAYWDTSDLQPGRWRTETVALSQFRFLGGFDESDWAHLTRMGLRIADSFAAYVEGTRYEIGLGFIHAYQPLPPPGAPPPPAGDLSLDEGPRMLSITSPRYRLELDRQRFILQLYLPGPGGTLAPVSPEGLFYGFDVEKGRSFEAQPVYQVLEREAGRIAVAAAAELPLDSRDVVLVTFTCLPDRFFTAVKYGTPMGFGYPCTRFAPSGSAAKHLFDHYAFRDEGGLLHRGAFAEYEERAGFGLSTFDSDGDRVPGFSASRPYLYLYDPSVPRGLCVVYTNYADRWRADADNCHFCYYQPDLDYFHLGLGQAPDCTEARVAGFYVDASGDPALIDGVVVPGILSQAATMPSDAQVPKGFTVRTVREETLAACPGKLRHTWANHMHWIGVGWGQGGDEVLASSIDETETMLALGAAGAVNFDIAGVERLAANRPEAVAKLKRLLQTGRLEVVGATYGQPLGSFHGAESNVRQLQWGVRVCQECLGVTPTTWWEEEYCFFPQLPQLLKLMGFQGAALYFQTTWIQPSLPHETTTSVIRWQAPDGSAIPTAAHTSLARWMPERLDSYALSRSELLKTAPQPLMLEWNELMAATPPLARRYAPAYHSMARLGIKQTTLRDYLRTYRGPEPVRSYAMDETFHGLPLGKCGDQVRRADKRIESTLLAAEALSAAAWLEGLPSPDEALREAWKNLLIFEGHDVLICEGCLVSSYPQYMQAAEEHAQQALAAASSALAQKVRTDTARGGSPVVVFNPLAWSRGGLVEVELPAGLADQAPLIARDENGGVHPCQIVGGNRLIFVADDVPSLGYRTFWLDHGSAESDLQVADEGRSLANRAVSVRFDETGGLRSLRDELRGIELLDPAVPAGELRATVDGQAQASSSSGPSVRLVESGPVRAMVEVAGRLTGHTTFTNRFALCAGLPPISVATDLSVGEQLDGLMMGSLRRVFSPAGTPAYYHDYPFGVSRTAFTNAFPKSHPFPEGAREEIVRNHITGLNFLDCQGEQAGLLYAHDGNQGFLRDDTTIANILSLYDPWDQGYYPKDQASRAALIPHGPWRKSDRLRAALELNRPLIAMPQASHAGTLPSTYSWLAVSGSSALTSAFYRDGNNLVIRLYDVDGRRQHVRLKIGRGVNSAQREDLRGERQAALSAAEGEVGVTLDPCKIATIRVRPAG